jgi:hypothetical protein
MSTPERNPDSLQQRLQPLAFGRSLHVDSELGTVEITSPEGVVELSVRCTSEGCVLRFANARLALSTPGRLDVRCQELVVDAAQRLELHSGGDYTSTVGGSSTTTVGGRIEADADEMFLHSRRGDTLLQANDYVRLVAEKVLLNSEQERRPTRDQLEAFWRGVGL